MEKNLLVRDLFKKYQKYYIPMLFVFVVVIFALFILFNNLANIAINTTGTTDANVISSIKYDFIGVQLLRFITFLLACVLPIILALIMGTYSSKQEVDKSNIGGSQLFSTRIVTGSLFILIPFLINLLIYFILNISGFFGSFYNSSMGQMLIMTIFGLVLSMLAFLLICTINIALRNRIVDSLLTLAIVLFITHVFYNYSINPIILIIIIVFVWLALLFLGYSMSKSKNR